MKLFLIFIYLLTNVIAEAQNVGVGTASPSEKLDVNGNINISGALKANGVAGSTGQVLMSTGTGLSWGSLMNFKKCVIITTGGSASWTVPAGVTEVMVELWGGGSGGTAYCGGSSGGYARTVEYVSPGYVINYTIGSGSLYGTISTSDGGTSTVSLPLGTLTALGGGGILNQFNKGNVYSGNGGLLSNAFYTYGNPGEPNSSVFGLKNSTTYVEIIKYGSGGAPVGLINSTAMEGDVVRLENGTQVSFINSFSSKLPGAGGAAGNGSGWIGAAGMVIFWYNK